MVFNRTYHVRAKQAAIGKLIAEGMLQRDPVDPHFYQQAVRPSRAAPRFQKRSGKLQGVQLELFPESPLADLFPQV